MLAQTLAKVQLLLEEAQQKLSEESVAVIERVYNDVVNLDNFIKKKVVEAENDKNLDFIQKKAAKREAFERAERKLEVLKDKRNYATMIEQIEIKLEDGAEAEEVSLLKFLQHREIRDRLATMTEAQILSHFGDSLFDGSNELLLDAILNAPPGFEILSEDILSNLRIIKAKKIHPDITDKIEAVEELKSKTMQIFKLIKAELDNLRLKELPEVIAGKD
jgi:DNA polymerase elongation subunit (family B)